MRQNILILVLLAFSYASAGIISGNLRNDDANPLILKSPSSTDACCNVCEDPEKEKYYSIVESVGHCGEACMKPSHYKYFKILEPGIYFKIKNLFSYIFQTIE